MALAAYMEPYISAKMPDISAEEPYIDQKRHI